MSGYDSVWHDNRDEENEYDEWLNEYYGPHHYQDKYLYDYQWYHEKFPKEWALNHKKGTGPGQCSNCEKYGCINTVFIGYCANCAVYEYDGKRGCGFIGNGIELYNEFTLHIPSAFDTYLQGVDLNSITEPGADNEESNDVINNGYNEDDYLNADPYDYTNGQEENADTGILNCHFEGGYNDF